jgi:ABC-type glycerol-3-phosphate transport system permease component
MTKTQRKRVATSARYLILTVWALIVAFPLDWRVMSSLLPRDVWFSWRRVCFPWWGALE